MTDFKNLNLNPKILAALESKGYEKPTPIQQQAIPAVISGCDILGIAQTGTGKTAAFSLPILHNLSAKAISVKSGNVRSLILTPTRELAVQIADNIQAYNDGLKLKYAVIFGGVNDKPQIASIQAGVDILIATPGRLLDLLDKGYIRFMQLETLVLDEADRMLDMGFIDDIKKIISKMPQKRQTLFFSATMPPAISKLANAILTNPTKIEIAPQSTTVERIDQRINFVTHYNKPKLLKHILKQKEVTSAVVFCRTKYGADDVADFLDRARISVAAIHGNKDQDARNRALDGFKDGSIKVLVATDVASRGIDVDGVSHVINYEMPSDPESYVHRIGRTGRAGRKGVAISFVDPKDDVLLPAVEKAINMTIPVDKNHPFHPGGGNAGSNQNKDSKPNNKSNTTQSQKKKGGILAFILGLFSSKKTEAKKQNKRPKNTQQKPEKSNHHNKNRVRPPRKNNSNPRGSKPRNPQPRTPGKSTPKPLPEGFTGPRKLSSGKK